MIFQRIMLQIINQHAFRNAVSVVLLIAQGCQAIARATLGYHMLCGEQRRRCCTFSAQSTINIGTKKYEARYKKNVPTP